MNSTATRRALTLVELLVVLAVIGILAALAVPHFLEAQTRAKVSTAKTNLRTVVGGLEAFAVDHGGYPATGPDFPGDPLGVLADHQLRGLTTPVAYITGSAFHDPFGQLRAQGFGTIYAGGRDSDGDFPDLSPPNLEKSIIYLHYPSMAERHEDPSLHRHGGGVVSLGPDSRDSLGGYRPFSPLFFVERFSWAGVTHPLQTIYDPTNGTISPGDISDFAGDAARFEVR